MVVLIKAFIIIVPILLSVAFLTVFERKILGAMQLRIGPNVVGYAGLLQPFADALKLILKESIIPSNSNRYLFIISPIITLTLSLINWVTIPIGPFSILSNINIGLLFILGISSLSVYGIIISGWSSNSKYAFLGSLRSTAQMISYEVSFGLILLSIILIVGSLNLNIIIYKQIYIYYILPLYSLFILFFISILAETNRPPFDLPEAEAELVAGYYVEYSAIGFVLFFIAEYTSILLFSFLTQILFWGSFIFPLSYIYPFIYVVPFVSVAFAAMKCCFILFLFVWVRVAFPRFRYDQLMYIGWKQILPASLAFLTLTASLLISFNSFAII